MKSFLIAILMLSSTAFGIAPTNNVPTSSDAFALDRGMGPTAFIRRLGTKLLQAHSVAYGTYDIGTSSTQQSGAANASYNVGIDLPVGAIIRNVWLRQVTAFSPAVGASVGLGINTVGDLKAAASSAAWTGTMAGVPDNTTTNSIVVTTGSTQIFVSVGAGAGSTLTAGKVKVFVDYVVTVD